MPDSNESRSSGLPQRRNHTLGPQPELTIAEQCEGEAALADHDLVQVTRPEGRYLTAEDLGADGLAKLIVDLREALS